MTEKQRTEIIKTIHVANDLKKFNASQIKLLTNNFEEEWVRNLLGNIMPPDIVPFEDDYALVIKEQENTFNIITKAFDDLYYEGSSYGVEQYSLEPPAYFGDYSTMLTAGTFFNDKENTEKALPQSPSDPAFAELCKSLNEQRAYFIEACKKMNAVDEFFVKGQDDAKANYLNIVELAKKVEVQKKQIDTTAKYITSLENKLKEAQAMAAKVAKKGDVEDTISVIKSMLKSSQNKRIEKREAVAEVIKNLKEKLKIDDVELDELLEHIDDEKEAPKNPVTPANVTVQPGGTAIMTAENVTTNK